jgi:NAD(P)H-hydrate repair Nnr-like enzyme with NAD(P)H-hydrate dehydratase domain
MPRLRPAPDSKEEPEKVAAAAEPEVVIEEAPEIEVEIGEPEVEAKQDDATAALKRQIEELKKSEIMLREQSQQFARDREEALERARQREAQIQKVQKESYDAQADAISSALAAANAERDKARLDIENAISLGDAKAQAEALDRLAIAAANLTRLEEGKAAAEARAKEPVEPAGVDVIDTWGLPKITSDWVKARRHLLTDPEKFEDLKGYQWQAKKAGLTPHTKEFLEFIEVKLGERESPEEEVVAEVVPEKKKGPMVSAPPSRDVPNSSGKRQSNGKVTLTPLEVEAAKIAGISVEEYAKQKVRKAEMVASGEYGEQR